jgi:hypothetical protein
MAEPTVSRIQIMQTMKMGTMIHITWTEASMTTVDVTWSGRSSERGNVRKQAISYSKRVEKSQEEQEATRGAAKPP